MNRERELVSAIYHEIMGAHETSPILYDVLGTIEIENSDLRIDACKMLSVAAEYLDIKLKRAMDLIDEYFLQEGGQHE